MSTKYAKRVTPMGIPNTRLDDLPDLIDVQKKSFEWFLKEGLKEELLAFSPVKDYTGRLELHFWTWHVWDAYHRSKWRYWIGSWIFEPELRRPIRNEDIYLRIVYNWEVYKYSIYPLYNTE